MNRFLKLLLALACLMMVAGCTSVVKRSTFHPCTDPNCKRCGGDGRYRCTKCLGRGHVHCTWCNGLGHVNCSHCRGRGWLPGPPVDKQKKKAPKQIRCSHCNATGRNECSHCNGLRMVECSVCDGVGMVNCGFTTYHWVCRACGERYDYPARPCPKCGAK